MGYGGYGGYQVGDPFLGGVFKGIGKVVGGAAKGFLTGGPIGAIGGAIGATGILGSGPSAMPVSRALPPVTGIGGRIQLPTGIGLGGGISFGPPVAQPRGPGALAPTDDGCPKGYRRNRSDYFTKTEGFVPAGSKCVRIRRTNPANASALRRAQRREEGFIRLARKSGLVTIPKSRRVRSAVRKK